VICPHCKQVVTEAVDISVEGAMYDLGERPTLCAVPGEDVYDVPSMSVCRPCWVEYVKPGWRLIIDLCHTAADRVS
jgi:hypothetical protein